MNVFTARVKTVNKRQMLALHPYKIWQSSDGQFLTYVYTEDGHRMIRRRKTRKALEDYLISFYTKQQEEVLRKELRVITALFDYLKKALKAFIYKYRL